MSAGRNGVYDYLLNHIIWPKVKNTSSGIPECGRVAGTVQEITPFEWLTHIASKHRGEI